MSFYFLPPAQCDAPYSISQINEGVAFMLENGATPVWVAGEISNFKRASSGHCYFKLKDAESQLTAVMWRSTVSKLKFDLHDGMAVTAIALLRVYQKGGYYQLDVQNMQEAGKGTLIQLFEELTKKLENEGLFDAAHKRPLPESVRRVGVITAKTGAAVKDIIRVIAGRSPQTDIVISDVLVQGDKAPADIARAIAAMNQHAGVDVLIVGRGGGSIEDLWAFNTEVVARAIYHSCIPVVSAVGHEIDFTIADFVADLRAPTPSAAAEMVVADESENLRYFESVARRFDNGMARLWLKNRTAFTSLESRGVFRQVALGVLDARQTLDDVSTGMQQVVSGILDKKKSDLGHFSARLSAVSPLNVLGRGYAVVTNGAGSAIKESNQLSIGERVTIQLHKGSIGAEVKEIIN